jgi:hypothetical protein
MRAFSDRPSTFKRVQFSVDFWDGNRPERHEFAGYPAVDAFAIAQINKLAASDRTAIEAVGRVKDAIRTMLDDSDGTPLGWHAEPLPPEVHVPSGELAKWPEEVDVESAQVDLDAYANAHGVVGAPDDDPGPEPQFLAPDGTVHPMRDAGKFAEFEAGSSRRRWVALMDGDNDLTVEAKTIMRLWQWLVSEAADRPTVR